MIARAVAALLLLAVPAAAAPKQPPVPAQVAPAERAAWRDLFAKLRAGEDAGAAAALAALPAGPLTPYAQAELLLAGRAPVSDPAAFVAANPDLPQAARLARKFGIAPDALPRPAALRWINYESAAPAARAQADALAVAVAPLVAADQPAAAEEAWLRAADGAAPDSRSEWARRVAWLHYIDGDDAGARRMGVRASEGSSEGAALGAWVTGLAAWRAGDCAAAATAFDAIAVKTAPADLRAAGAYWASRAYLACERPDLVAARLKTASGHAQSFYGMLARRALGLSSPLDWAEPDFIKADWNTLAALPGARRAAALAEIGQLGLADRELRHLAAVADAGRYEAIMRLAARLSLPATQLWLSQRSPTGARAPLSARFPAPDWTPQRGWRVDQSLVYAHALQESRFATDVVSRAGARGVLQVMPAAAAETSREWGETADASRLNDPSFNIECGQTYMERLRDMSYTGGLLPKVIAAYNAGPGSVQKWNATVRDNGDPLLFIESIPFKETRHYVEVVLRNYWMYQLRQGQAVTSKDALAQNMWPRFPGMAGPTAVRLDPAAAVQQASATVLRR